MSQHEPRSGVVARFDAEQRYYKSLFEQAERAMRGEAPVPAVPDLSELNFVDGRLTWRGMPVWPCSSKAHVSVRTSADTQASLARAARLQSLNQRANSYRRVVRHRMVRRGAAPDALARFDAETDFYNSLFDQAERAKRGEAPVPEVPARCKLEFVDGWLVWKGQPVWWSGYRAQAEPAVRAPAASALEQPTPRERPKLRRLLALPWRRAAA